MLYGVDISEHQGKVDWDALNAVANFVVIRSGFGMSRADLQLRRNQSEARRVRDAAGPLGIGYYHYSYPQYNAPEGEADFFLKCVGELQTGEFLALDWEEANGDTVGWCLAFLNRVKAKTGIKPLLYLNQALMNAHDWSPVINSDYGLWLAQYDNNQEGTGPTTPWPVLAMRQWTSTTNVAGIGGNVDGDTFYGGFAELARYGLPAPVTAPQLTPVPTPEPAPAPVPMPTSMPAPVDSIQPPSSLPTPAPSVEPTPIDPTKSGFQTSEFYVVLAAVLSPLASKYFGITVSSDDLVQLVSLLAAAVTAIVAVVVYVRSRTKIKTAAAAAAAAAVITSKETK